MAIVIEAGKLRWKSAIIDGEVVTAPRAGRENGFNGIKSAIARGGRDLVFVAFDLLFLDGKDLRSEPLEQRRSRRVLRRCPIDFMPV